MHVFNHDSTLIKTWNARSISNDYAFFVKIKFFFAIHDLIANQHDDEIVRSFFVVNNRNEICVVEIEINVIVRKQIFDVDRKLKRNDDVDDERWREWNFLKNDEIRIRSNVEIQQFNRCIQNVLREIERKKIAKNVKWVVENVKTAENARKIVKCTKIVENVMIIDSRVKIVEFHEIENDDENEMWNDKFETNIAFQTKIRIRRRDFARNVKIVVEICDHSLTQTTSSLQKFNHLLTIIVQKIVAIFLISIDRSIVW